MPIKSNTIRHLGFVLLGIALAALSVEVAARIQPAWFSAILPAWRQVFVLDPKTGYRLIPNRRVKIRPSIDHDPYWLVTDSQGFRNPQEYPQADIVAVGDSMTEGVGVPDEFTWVRQLERMSGLSVANLGLRGYGGLSKAAVAERYGLPKQPRIVLTQYGEDIGYLSHADPGNDGQNRSLPRRLRSFLHSHSVTYALLKAAAHPWLDLLTQRQRKDQTQIAAHSTLFSINGHTVRLTTEPPYLENLATRSLRFLTEHPDNARLNEMLFQLKRRCVVQGAHLVVVLIPDPLPTYFPLIVEQIPPSEIREAAARNVDADATLLASFCADNELIFIDTTPSLRAAAAQGEPLCFPIDPHWDVAGHRLIAREIYRILIERGLLSRSDP